MTFSASRSQTCLGNQIGTCLHLIIKTGREEDSGEKIGQGNPGTLASRTRRWLTILRASLVGEMVKNLPALRETWVRSLGG